MYKVFIALTRVNDLQLVMINPSFVRKHMVVLYIDKDSRYSRIHLSGELHFCIT